MITGKYPFKGEHDASLFYSIINQTPEPLARYKTNISEGFQRIIDKSLDKDQETRYQHIDELLSDLRRERKESGEHKIDKRRTRKSKSRIAVIISAVASVVLGIVLIIYLLNNPTKNIKPPKHTQLTFEGNISLYGPAYDISRISPDGQFTAYLAGGEGNKNSIYVRDNSGDQAIEIFKGLNSVSSLRWSPSGNEIFFSAFSSTSRSSYIIPRLGGKSQELKFNEYGCWSPDEKFIAGTSPPEKIIRLINRETGEVEKTVELKGNFTWLIDLDFSPIGDEIVFLTFDENKTSYIIWIIKTDGTEQQKILEEKKRLDSPRWSHDGNHIYYIQSNNMTQDLMKIEVPSFTADIKPKVIQTGLNMHGFSITRDSKKLCYTKYNVYSNMWNFTYDERTNLFQSKKLSEGTSTFEMPVISPNGEEIAFVHNDNIYKMSIYGSLMKQLTFLNSGCYCPSWSPDGKKIAFLAESKLYSISSEGGSPTVLSNNISGSYIYWGSKSEIFYQKQGYRNYFVYNLMTQKKELLVSNDSVGFMLNPQLSPDSLMVAVWWNRSFENEMVKSLWVISRGDLTQKFLVRGYIFPLEWSEDSKWIYAIDTYKTPSEILKVSVNTRLTKVIYTLPYGKISQNNIDITPDGNTIVCSVPETNSDVWMIENFDPDIE
jgi:Tol biopolymer transport system component